MTTPFDDTAPDLYGLFDGICTISAERFISVLEMIVKRHLGINVRSAKWAERIKLARERDGARNQLHVHVERLSNEECLSITFSYRRGNVRILVRKTTKRGDYKDKLYVIMCNKYLAATVRSADYPTWEEPICCFRPSILGVISMLYRAIETQAQGLPTTNICHRNDAMINGVMLGVIRQTASSAPLTEEQLKEQLMSDKQPEGEVMFCDLRPILVDEYHTFRDAFSTDRICNITEELRLKIKELDQSPESN